MKQEDRFPLFFRRCTDRVVVIVSGGHIAVPRPNRDPLIRQEVESRPRDV